MKGIVNLNVKSGRPLALYILDGKMRISLSSINSQGFKGYLCENEI